MEHNITRGATYMLIAAFAGAVVATTCKGLATDFSIDILFWLTRVFLFIGIIPLFIKGAHKQLKTTCLGKHFLISVFYVSALYAYFYSLTKVPLVDVSLLFNSAPLYVPFIAFFCLGESLWSKKLWLGILISFIGVVCVLQPGSEVFKPVSLIPFISGVLIAISQVCNRLLSKTEPPERIIFYMMIFSPILAAIPLLIAGDYATQFSSFHFQHISFLQIILLLLVGIAGWVFQLYRAKAAACARVAAVMPFSYAAVIFVGFFDWLFWGRLPNYLSVIGGLLIVSGSILLLAKTERI